MIAQPRRIAAALLLSLGLGIAAPVAAQSLFSPAAYVNESVVTEFEVDQRRKMLQLFRAPDTSREEAISNLIDERLQLNEAARAGVTVSAEELADGKREFAGRADLTVEQFVGELASAGIDPASFDDFIRAGVAWRKIVRARFGPGATVIPDDQVAQAASAPPEAGLRVLLNEIIVPANTPQAAARAQSLAPQISAIRSFDAFAAAARQYSATPSRTRGGAIDWLEISNLPPQISSLVLSLSPGEVTPPIPLSNALAFFQLREVGEVATSREPAALEYAALSLPGGQSAATLQQAAQIAARVDTCRDLETLGPVQRERQPVGEIPQDVALELAKLDAGEISTSLTRAEGQTLLVLMLCERSYRETAPEEQELGELRNSLVSQQAAQKAENLMAELRANAVIRRQ